MSAPRLHLIGISRRYPGVIANDAVTLSVPPGEIHGLIGENGAGKSTLMRIAAGALRADAGEIRIDGRPVLLDSPATARASGIVMVHQHFALFESLSVVENILLVMPPGTRRGALAARIDAIGARHGLAIDPSMPVHALSVGERQRVEILRALMLAPRLLILDEPTAVLAPAAIEPLFATLEALAAEGTSIVYASHKLAEVRRLCHRVTVLRGGRNVGECDPRRESLASLSRRMFGGQDPREGDPAPGDGQANARTRRAMRPPGQQRGAAMLEVRGLSLAPRESHGRPLHDINLVVGRHQIVGLAGISGNGQAELLAALVGEDRRAPAEAIRLEGRPVGRASVRARREHGLGYLPEDRLGTATVADLGLERNLLLTHADPALFRAGLIRERVLAARTAAIVADFDVRRPGPGAAARSLSGGNLQKYVVGRELARRPSLLIAAQPTWGVDAAAARRIREALRVLRDDGAGLLVVSEDLGELFELADVLVVMADGRVSAPVAVADALVEDIGARMTGGHAMRGLEAR